MELEIERRTVVQVDFEALKDKYPEEWKETLEAFAGDENDAQREFVIECWQAGISEEAFTATVFDDVDYWLT